MITFKSGTTRGVLKFFNTKKGFGFVVTNEGDIFLHVTTADRFEPDTLVSGSLVELDYKTSEKGLEATRVHSITEPPVYAGEVKFYQAEKRFGFISCSELGDVFLHHSVASKAGVVPWSGLKVGFHCVPGKKAMEATAIWSAHQEEPVDESIDDGRPVKKVKKIGGKKGKMNGTAVLSVSV